MLKLFFIFALKTEIEKNLISINARFYEDISEDFSSTRQSPWPGWERLYDIWHQHDFTPKAIFDVGCGNARFLDFIIQKYPKFKYLGIDNSQSFINLNQKKHTNPDYDFRLVDLGNPLPEEISILDFDLILLIAVLHHIPGYRNRLELLRLLSEQLSNGGYFVITYWDFLTDQSLRKKVYPWTEVGIDTKDVEEGDYLLNWGLGPKNLRYCHFFSETEKRKIIDDLGLKLISGYQSDGRNERLNTYHVFIK